MKRIQGIFGSGSRRGFSIVLVVSMLLALGIMVVAFVRKGRQQAFWALRHVHDQAALEAAMAGIVAAEDRLRNGRWYGAQDPSASSGMFEIPIDDRARSSALVVCRDSYSRVSITNGTYETSRGKVNVSTPHGYFHVLHSVGVFSRGTCGTSARIVFARFVISPGPLAFGGSMEGIRILADGRSDEFPYDDLVCATWEGNPPGMERRFVTLPGRCDKNGARIPDTGKWKYRLLVSTGSLFKKGQGLLVADLGGRSVEERASQDGKVILAPVQAGEGDFDEPVMTIQDLNSFESSGHTLKKMVGIIHVPDDKVGTGNPTDEAGCCKVILEYSRSLRADVLRRAGVIFENEPSLASGPLSDSEARAAVGEGDREMTGPEFLLKALPGFVPPGLSEADRLEFEEKASVVLDKEPSSPDGPSPEIRAIHNHYLGPWPIDKAAGSIIFEQPGAIGRMLGLLGPRASEGSISTFIRNATVLRSASYRWACEYRGPFATVDPTWEVPPGAEWITVGGDHFLVLSHGRAEWADNAYDLEFNGKRIRMSDVASFLYKIVSDSGEMPEPGGPEFPVITDSSARSEEGEEK